MNVSQQFAAVSGKVRSAPLRNFKARLPAMADNGMQPHLSIQREQRSGKVDLAEGTQAIGGDPACDIVILGLEPKTYFNLSLETEKGVPSIVVHILADDIRLNGRDLAKDAVLRLKPSDELQFGGATCKIGGIRQPARPASRRRIVAALLLSLSAGLIALLVVDGVGTSKAPPVQPQQRVLRTPTNVLINELRDALRMSSLKLDVRLDQSGSEVQIGDAKEPLTISEKQKLAGILASFERRSELPLKDMTRLTSGLDSFVASIALEPVKFVVGSDGRRYREGDLLAEKWRVESIQPGGIVVSREGKQDIIATAPVSTPVVMHLATRDQAIR
ncbi:hypothetical protein ACFSE1_09075 [Rhizobium helianthi]|uniref:YscD/Y4YQ C-terminal domain-containing protein n=1 Tax=Rhizobium helianthi TaxID=1132695 RepID=A0ABW4M2U5_9HYPH